MESSSSSHNTAVSSSSRLSSTKLPAEQNVSKQNLVLERPYELEELYGEPILPQSTRRSWLSRTSRAFVNRNPRTGAWITKAIVYLRGPRPKVDLHPPSPLLDIDVHVAGRHIMAPVESTIIKTTRPLTAPWIFVILAAAYIIGFAFFSRAQSFLTPPSSFIGCTSTFYLANNACGQDGDGCGPFGDSSFDFRCPAQCNNVILQNPRTVGNEQVVFKPLLVGGGDSNRTYRGDSFICSAAIQAGIISSQKGGCGSLNLIENFTDFLPFTSHGLTSIGFPTVFPIAFQFLGSTSLSHCADLRNEALAFNILVTSALFILLRPKSIVLYWCLVCIGFWHVILFSQPTGPPPKLDVAFESFLPVLFIAYTFWRLGFRFVMPAFRSAPFESCILYLSGFWVGVLNNLTFDKLPLSRLTSSDLGKRNGAITTLAVMLVIIVILAINQMRVIRKTGWLPYYAGWYIAGGLVTLVLALLPGLELRLHHYIIPMIIIPGTAFPTRLSAIYQGLLLGLFLNGTAAFGLDSILQTADDLRQDAPLGSDLPTWLTNSTNYNTTIPFANQTILWDALIPNWDGFALLVDDVQRYAGPALNFSLASLNASLPHFFRLAVSYSLIILQTFVHRIYSTPPWARRAISRCLRHYGQTGHGLIHFLGLHRTYRHNDRRGHYTNIRFSIVSFSHIKHGLKCTSTVWMDQTDRHEIRTCLLQRGENIHSPIQMQQQQQQMYGGQSRYGAQQFPAPQYAYPQSRYGGMGMGMGGRRGGMGGMGLPLMGGMAGGLLLGDMLDNDFGGGGWGGGGGDWGGGGFGDLAELLESSSLPPLHHILQSFSPLPQVTTRTTTLVSVPHTSFTLRFSDLQDVEDACREDDEQRAIRTIDWITARISKHCAKWVRDMEDSKDNDSVQTPWWNELQRCAEGDFVPAKTEAWNHPVALIFAVSTTAPNPLQAITALHSRTNQLPPWVDTNFLRYTLIIHPHNSLLSAEEAGALYNAVKKQFGLHSYLLSLDLPKPPPPPIRVPALMPRLPQPPAPGSPQPRHFTTPTTPNIPGSSSNPNDSNTIRMQENDIQQTARFAREFVVMSLVPWMEKCVVEWNENFSSTRRLPSRLFSSTRRLFGSQTPTPVPTPPTSSSTSSLTGRPASISLNGGPTPPSQQRRLAEFATILGDFKLAVTVWETLRKDNKGGSDMLPLLLSPSPTIPLYAQASLAATHPNMSDLPPHAQIRVLSYAVRWEAGISTTDFVSNMLEGERWLVWAASNGEEAPSALLLAQAALLSTKKNARRRAALWYVAAATRLEKCGIKPLTMYFLRKAENLYSVRPLKELSPSFWDSEGKSPLVAEGLEDIMSGITHPLGRLLYTTGDLAGAVKLFLSLLRGASTFSSTGVHAFEDGSSKFQSNDKVYLDDFRVAYNYWKSTEPDKISKAGLTMPLKLCVNKHSRLRFSGDNVNGDSNIWWNRQEDWKTFWKSRGERENVVAGGKVSTNELFWVDLIMHNPLDAEINLSNVTLVVEATTVASEPAEDFVEVEIIKEVILSAKGTITVPISLRAKQSTALNITHAKYDFLSLLSTTESLAFRGRRLHDTPLQRQHPTYAPDVVMKVDVVPSEHRLFVTFIEDERLVLLQGENKQTRLWLTNAGSKPIGEVWMIAGADDEIWLGTSDKFENSSLETEVIRSSNSLKPQEPQRLSLNGAGGSTTINPGESVEVPAIFHAEILGDHELCLLFVFREADSQPFHTTTLTRSYEVQPLFKISVTAEPSQSQEHAFILGLDMTNVSQTASIDVMQLTCISPHWTCNSLTEKVFGSLAPTQCFRFLLGASYWGEGTGSEETFAFVANQLSNVLKGGEVEPLTVPPIDLQCSYISQSPNKRSIKSAAITSFIQSGRRRFMAHNISRVHSYIAPASHPAIFPLYNPSVVDIIIFWEIPARGISGHVNVHGITLGAGHARLDSIIEDAESAKVKRSMYAETRRENMEVLDAIRNSEWNAEMNPLALSLKDVGTKLHDFTLGPCHLPLEFRLRNHSVTRPANYTLKLRSDSNSSPNLLPPPYFGRMTFRGTIAPSEFTTVHPKLWVTKPGAYSLNGWVLETEISVPVADANEETKKRRYLLEPPMNEEACVVIRDSRAC
ncbi:hypothetical protein CVT25_005673 [Psilocybe cyanescens]|uniref:LCCL domain-containing protein n=1 Tax=Psilocybe cyanescens TaxID=93625 RepID=A0A409VLC7_PSICY|nr:hypothetical protein CVT25_005673 [Psilocybe cyanescens]